MELVFALLQKKKNVKKIKKFFSKDFMPYEIGFISKKENKIRFNKFIKMVKKKTCVFISGQGSNLKNLIFYLETIVFQLRLV